MSANNNVFEMVRDQALGTLQDLLVVLDVKESVAKGVMRDRLLKKAFNTGFSMKAWDSKKKPLCGGMHGYSVGVNPGKAGIIWDYVSVGHTFSIH